MAVTGRIVWSEGRFRLADQVTFNAAVRRKLDPGDGETFIVRVEREDDAKKHHQLKWYFGYIVKQCCEKTGYTPVEMDTIFRALFLDPEVTTVSENTYEQQREFNLHCEQYAAEAIGVTVVGPDDARHFQP